MWPGRVIIRHVGKLSMFVKAAHHDGDGTGCKDVNSVVISGARLHWIVICLENIIIHTQHIFSFLCSYFPPLSSHFLFSSRASTRTLNDGCGRWPVEPSSKLWGPGSWSTLMFTNRPCREHCHITTAREFIINYQTSSKSLEYNYQIWEQSSRSSVQVIPKKSSPPVRKRREAVSVLTNLNVPRAWRVVLNLVSIDRMT